jgi:membrane-associated phospholipid phosphatase
VVTESGRLAFPTRALVAGALFFVIALFLDQWAWDHLRREGIYDKDWGRLLRIMGFLPTWLAGAAALILHDHGGTPPPSHGPWRRGLLLALAPLAAGLICEVLKLLIRRERPGPHDGDYFFRAFDTDTWSTRGLGLPSSHAMVAFSAAAMLSFLFPRTWPVWWLLAAGAGYTRIAAGAHFLSDVALAAFAGWLVSWTVWYRLGPWRQQRVS